nr:MAG TPA: hypothetical protein [Caudoviricetes sp.]
MNTLKRNLDLSPHNTKGNPHRLGKAWEQIAQLQFLLGSVLGVDVGSDDGTVMYIQDTGNKEKGKLYIDKNNGKLYMCLKNTVRVSNTESEFEEFTLNSTYKSDVVDRGSVYFLNGASEYSAIIPANTRIEVKNLSDLSGVLNLSIKAKAKDESDVMSYRLYIEDRESRAYTFAQPTLKKKIGEKIYVIFDTDVKKNSCRVDYYLYR